MKEERKTQIQQIIIMLLIAIVLLLCSIPKAKAFTYTTDFSLYEQWYLGANVGASGGFVKKEVLNDNCTNNFVITYNLGYKGITCDTDYCGIEFSYTANYFKDNNVSNVQWFAMGGTIIDSNLEYPQCSVNGNTIDCIVRKGAILDRLQLKFQGTGISSVGQAMRVSLTDNVQTFNIYNSAKEIEEINDTDISQQDKQQPDQTDYNNYQQSEQQLFDIVENADTSSIQIAMDTNTTNWIWNTITSLIQSNALVFNMIISILSIGVIKLALAR